MANKKLKYLIFDTETATLPMVSEIAQNAEEKKKLAILKPLIYDIGWTIMDRKGNVEKKESFLIAETFAVPSIFNTAYYAWKRPLYLEALAKGETSVKPWNEVMKLFEADLKSVDFVGAYNVAFDQRALSFTETYMQYLYSPDFSMYEQKQKNSCSFILTHKNLKNAEKENDPMHLTFRGEKYPNFDIWGMACSVLLNSAAYKNLCFETEMISASGEFFKTSAESSYRFLCKKYDFEEAHTALADAEIESYILAKVLRKRGITQGIQYFPFRELGTTVDYLTATKRGRKAEWFDSVIVIMEEKIQQYEEKNPYCARVEKNISRLKTAQEEWFY